MFRSKAKMVARTTAGSAFGTPPPSRTNIEVFKLGKMGDPSELR